MGFWSEFVKSFKEQAENSKELNESMAELKKLQESESLKKTKESVEKLKDKSVEGLAQLKNLGEKAAATGGRVTARVSDSVTSTLGDITQRVGIDEKLEKTKEGIEKVADSLNKARENIEKVGENIKTSAEESELVKKVKERVPFGLLDGSDAASGEAGAGGGEGAAAAARSQLVVKTQEVQTAIEKRLNDARERLRSTGAFKKALALREKIVESDNPLIQRVLDLGDGITRTTSKLFSENDHAKTIKLIHELDPTFSPEKFKQRMASSFVPALRSALLRGDPAPINAHMSKRLAEHELEAYKEWDAHGYRSHSKLLNLDTVEILSAHTRDDGRPTLLIHFVSQENHCIRDSSGAVVEGAPDNIQDVEQTWAMQINSQGEWEVIEYMVIASRPSW